MVYDNEKDASYLTHVVSKVSFSYSIPGEINMVNVLVGAARIAAAGFLFGCGLFAAKETAEAVKDGRAKKLCQKGIAKGRQTAKAVKASLSKKEDSAA